ncbi:AraC family transcriptional regulator [Chitinophaga sancti]|uniref:AraC family transcriptional regulator n=1 Tax=Chitinophaga sancti TaxID=1004 RepID=UPI002A765EEC|nr:AraC family transcriptional regulator [Chitinophaga sancti]WPQ63386.1 AraC family transcriptional regulator [Chitinophaga sancti]
MLTHPAGKTEKLFYVEKGKTAFDDVSRLPEEYLQLVLPYAGVYFEQDAECDIISQTIALRQFSFWIQEVYAHEALILCPFAPIPIWALHFMYDASLQVQLYENKSLVLQERECNLFSLESDIHKVPLVRGQKLLSCHINILPEKFQELARKYPSLRNLAKLKSPGVSGPLNKYPYHINQVCNFILRKMLTCRHINFPAECFLFRCCLDLFFNFAQQDKQLPLESKHVLYTNELNQLFNFVIENPHQPCSTKQLALLFEIPEEELAPAFLLQFSTSLKDFILMVKMMMIFALLTEKGTSLTEIASVAGFRNWESMNTAFNNYYECELEELRRAM